MGVLQIDDVAGARDEVGLLLAEAFDDLDGLVHGEQLAEMEIADMADPHSVELGGPKRGGNLGFANHHLLGEVPSVDPPAADAVRTDRKEKVPDAGASILGQDLSSAVGELCHGCGIVPKEPPKTHAACPVLRWAAGEKRLKR